MTGAPEIRVALVAPTIAAGGVETVMFGLAKFFLARGLAVEFVVTDQPGEWGGRAAEFGPVRCPDSGPDWPPARCARVGRLLAAGNYDLVLLNHARYAQAALGLLPDRVAAVPVLHNDNPEIYRVACANPLAWNALVGVSPLVTMVAAERLPGRPVQYIPNGVELPGAEQRRTRRAWQPKLSAAFVGRVTQEQKGVFFLPEIVAGCRRQGLDVELRVAGDGPDLAELKDRTRAAGLDGLVEFLGMIKPGQVRSLLLDSHLLLMPSFYEGLPIVALEAQACGCVPVASALPGITDAAIAPGETGLLAEPGRADGFVAAVAGLARSPEQWDRMSRAGQARVAGKFSVDAMGSAYLGLFEAIRAGRLPLPRPRARGPRFDRSLFSRFELMPPRLRAAELAVRKWLGDRRGRAG